MYVWKIYCHNIQQRKYCLSPNQTVLYFMITAIGYKSECMCHKKINQACHQDQHKQDKRKDENNK